MDQVMMREEGRESRKDTVLKYQLELKNLVFIMWRLRTTMYICLGLANRFEIAGFLRCERCVDLYFRSMG